MERIIDAIELRTDVVKVVLKSVPDSPGTVGSIFTALGEGGFNVELITQTGAAKDLCDVAFTVQAVEAERVLDYLRERLIQLGAKGVLIDKNLALIVLFGAKLSTTPALAGRVFSLLGRLGISVETINAGLMTLAFLVPKKRAEGAVKGLKELFGLS